ncbi:hypothetical protein ACFLUX_01440 [Chloroflexota bacterium]
MDIADKISVQYSEVMNRLYKSRGRLRFGRGSVSISSIAQQYYCEKALELSFEHPLPQTERMKQGEAGHESITTLATPISREGSIQEAIKEKPVCIYEFSIAWEYKGIPILGLVDEAWFREGNVDLVVERKFSNSLKIYSPYHVQAQLYCLGLGEMGFNNSDTLYRIMVFKRGCVDCPELEERSCSIFNDFTSYQCNKGGSITYTYPFDKQTILKDLDWAIEFWLGNRNAVPTKVQAKCRVCQHKGLCEFSLA